MKFLFFRENKRKGVFLGSILVLSLVMLVFVSVYFNLSLGFELASTGSAYYNGNKENGGVSIMINVYEGSDVVSDMLETLEENNAKATFFIGGCWATKNNETILKIKEAGHEIGNHGFYHKDHKTLSYDKNIEEISTTHKVVNGIAEVEMSLFAPPSGSYNKNTLDAASNQGYKTIMWTKDTIDWRDSDENTIFKRATNGVKAGDLILMHPKPHTAKVLDRILKYYAENNLKTLTVSENINFG